MTPENPIVGGTTLRIPAIQSPSFSLSGKTGWAIFSSGAAYFFSVSINGTLTATGADGSEVQLTPGTSAQISLFPAGFPAGGTAGLLFAEAEGGGSGEQLVTVLEAPAFSGSKTTPAILLSSPSEDGVTLLSSITLSDFNYINVANAEAIIAPSGDSTGATDAANINFCLTLGLGVQLLPAPLSAPYYINSPILPQSQSRIWGGQWWSASENDDYSEGPGTSGGSVIVMVPAFAGDAAISMPDPGAGIQNYGVDIAGLTIEGFEIGSGTIYGIHVVGAWGAGFLRGCTIHRPPADCLRMEVSSATGKIPDEWIVSQTKFSASRNGYGAYLSDLADSMFLQCNASENTLDNWFLNYGVNTRFTDCKGENGHANGWHLTGIAGGETVRLNCCSSGLNQENGFLFDDSGPSHGGTNSTYILTGCVTAADGQGSASAGYAGFQASGCKARIIATGCFCQEDGSSAHPEYGASEVSSSYGMCFTGSLLQGATAATHDDGSNTHVLTNQSPVPF